METFISVIVVVFFMWVAYQLLKPKRKDNSLKRSIDRKIDEENRAADRGRDFG